MAHILLIFAFTHKPTKYTKARIYNNWRRAAITITYILYNLGNLYYISLVYSSYVCMHEATMIELNA